MKRILVFGANGFVGSTFVEMIDQSQYNVLRIAHREDNNPNTIIADVSDGFQINSIIEKTKPDYIINLAGIHSIAEAEKEYSKTINTNVIGSINILNAVFEHSPNTKVLLVGSSEVYDNKTSCLVESDNLRPRNVYGMTKLWQEQMAQTYIEKKGLMVICTRSFNHIGIRQKETTAIASFCQQAAEIATGLREPIIQTGNLDVERDFLDVRDVVKAYISLLETVDSGIYNVCSGKKTRLIDLLERIIEFTGKNVEIQTDPKRVRSIDLPIIVGSNGKILRDTSWIPTISLENTLREIYTNKMEKITK